MERESEGREVCQIGKDKEVKVQEVTRRLALHSFPIFFPCSVMPAVSQRGQRPTSSFVYSGMWAVLTSRLFIDSTQLRVLLSLNLSSVRLCFYSIICVIRRPGLTETGSMLGNANQRSLTYSRETLKLYLKSKHQQDVVKSMKEIFLCITRSSGGLFNL